MAQKMIFAIFAHLLVPVLLLEPYRSSKVGFRSRVTT